MKVLNKQDTTIEWGQEPEDGMILVGFTCDAVLEGKILKEEIIELLKEKEVGYRKAVILFKKQGLTSFDEAKRIVDEIKQDLIVKKNNTQKVLAKKYVYSINRVFWAYEQDIPTKDPRYVKLNVIDLENMDFNNYINEDKSFNAEKFIRENLSEEDLAQLKKNKKKGFVHVENAPIDKTGLDNEWNTNKQ